MSECTCCQLHNPRQEPKKVKLADLLKEAWWTDIPEGEISSDHGFEREAYRAIEEVEKRIDETIIFVQGGISFISRDNLKKRLKELL